MARGQCAGRAAARRSGRDTRARGEETSAHDLHRVSPGELLFRSQPPWRHAGQVSEPLRRHRGALRRAFADPADGIAVLPAVPGSAPLRHRHESSAGNVSRHVPTARNCRRTFLSPLFLTLSLAPVRLGAAGQSLEKGLSWERVETITEPAVTRNPTGPMPKFHLLLLIGLLPGVVSLAAADQFRAGAAVVDITPTNLPIRTAGNLTLTVVNKVHDPLHSRALVLDDGSTQVAMA